MHVFVKLTRSEFRLLLREPMQLFWIFVFPSLLVVILGCVPPFREPSADLGGLRVIDLYVTIAIILTLASLALQVAPMALATYRERGILRRLATTPARPVALLGAQLVMSLLTAIGAVVLLLLVTHFMEEAERLCDRVALIDAGAVVALDTPAGLVARVSAEQRIRFRPSVPLDDSVLTGLAEVREVRRHGTQLEVIGEGNVLHAVTAALAAHRIIANDLRVEQASLDDAYVALTGRTEEK